ncbi:hypothetical protein [Roseomonas mucosa]|uniref:hypothetical protein n=1 Tax=Roseomonas mucosa TaxID=207340 RepID=UPI00223F0F58|nr:hypothetical protein [Roseomonas mucosa]
MTDLKRFADDAEALLKQATDGGLTPVYARLGEEMERARGVVAFDSLFPELQGALGMAAEGRDPHKFASLFLERIRFNLCRRGGRFDAEIRTGVNSSVSATLTALSMRFGLPEEVMPLLVPITVLIAISGLEAFCAGAGAHARPIIEHQPEEQKAIEQQPPGKKATKREPPKQEVP